MTTEAEKRINQESRVSTYEGFTNRPFYEDINRRTVQLLAPAKTVVDIATGTGAIITQLIENKKLLPGFWVVGCDPDEDQLKTAENKFEDVAGGVIEFENASAEHLLLPDEFADTVTFCNAAHLTDLPVALKESARVLKPGKPIGLNTAYASDLAYPDGSRRTWGVFVAMARKIAVEEYGVTDLKDPQDVLRYSSKDIREIAEDAGYENISMGQIVAHMNQKDLEAIGRYKEFTEGALPGVEYEIAAKCLQKAVPITLERRNTDFLPRGWLVMYGFKKAA